MYVKNASYPVSVLQHADHIENYGCMRPRGQHAGRMPLYIGDGHNKRSSSSRAKNPGHHPPHRPVHHGCILATELNTITTPGWMLIDLLPFLTFHYCSFGATEWAIAFAARFVEEVSTY